MGSDDLFRKRKVQTIERLKRQQGVRSKGERFLIVSEGEKTEPYYFNEFCEFHQLRTPRVRIAPGEEGSSPDRVVDYANKLYDDDSRLGSDNYDQVFCVIDRDSHSKFDAAIQRIEELRLSGKPFVAIPSYPCFEYWLLIHFKPTRQYFQAVGKCSVCDKVIRELRNQQGFNAYAKADRGVYRKLKDRTSAAIKHAKQARIDADRTGEKNPSTDVYILVEKLMLLGEMYGRRQ